MPKQPGVPHDMFPRQPAPDDLPAPPAGPPPQLCILADDLTGACDAAVAFATPASPVRVSLHHHLQPDSSIWAISTNSRDLPASDASALLERLLTRVPPGCELFKKIDSVLRGNTFAEIATAVRSVPAELVLLSPAYPATGRAVRHGILYADEPSVPAIPIADRLRAHACDTHLLPPHTSPQLLAQHIGQALSQGHRVLLCDAHIQPHLEAAVHAARSLALPTLWIGSGGLAHALARQHLPLEPPPPSRIRPGHLLFFIGSNHPVTRGQVSHLRRMSGLSAVFPSPHATLFELPRSSTPDDLRRSLAPFTPNQVGCLFLTGGDTAALVCEALGITSLCLQGEFAPGIPIAVAEGGPSHGVSVILKSGGFGERALLCRILDACAGREPHPNS